MKRTLAFVLISAATCTFAQTPASDISTPVVPGAQKAISKLDALKELSAKSNEIMLKRAKACGQEVKGAMAQYRCIVTGKGAASPTADAPSK